MKFPIALKPDFLAAMNFVSFHKPGVWELSSSFVNDIIGCIRNIRIAKRDVLVGCVDHS